METTAKRIEALPIKIVIADLDSSDSFIYPDIDCRDYASFSSLPLCLEYQGLTYVRSAFNSDTGSVAYRRSDNIAREI